MRLSEDHVAKLVREVEDPGRPSEYRETTRQEYDQVLDTLLAGNPADVWFFAYGSLIWKPACEVVELRTGLLRGWHRSFCLGWNTRFRGSDENPGLMLAIDRGGACKGVLYRLPPNDIREQLEQLLRREMGWWPSAFPPRWVNVQTAEGPIRAITFAMDRKSPRYITGLSNDEIAAVLASAVGFRGSMAEYLYATVKHLEDLGLHDSHLWELQEKVAERIEAAFPG